MMQIQCQGRVSGVNGYNAERPGASIWFQIDDPKGNYQGITFAIKLSEVQQWMDLIGKNLLLTVDVDVLQEKR